MHGSNNAIRKRFLKASCNRDFCNASGTGLGAGGAGNKSGSITFPYGLESPSKLGAKALDMGDNGSEALAAGDSDDDAPELARGEEVAVDAGVAAAGLSSPAGHGSWSQEEHKNILRQPRDNAQKYCSKEFYGRTMTLHRAKKMPHGYRSKQLHKMIAENCSRKRTQKANYGQRLQNDRQKTAAESRT